MILNQLKQTVDQNQGKNPLYIRSLLKEQLQYYLLNFVYNSRYGEKFLFKGGTCLRFCFDLPRLSEDLDFDVDDFDQFDFDLFLSDIQTYFKNTLQYTNFELKISGVNKIIYLKFPILNKLGLPVSLQKPSQNLLNIRIDLAPVAGEGFSREISLKSTYDFAFLIRRYSLADLYAGKLAAVLGREKWQSGERVARFNGRDYFDIWWLREQGAVWNSQYLQSLTNISSEAEVISMLNDKIQEAVKRKSELKQDLLPFFENPMFVEDVIDNLHTLNFAKQS